MMVSPFLYIYCSLLSLVLYLVNIFIYDWHQRRLVTKKYFNKQFPQILPFFQFILY